jgi:hypothetical protein
MRERKVNQQQLKKVIIKVGMGQSGNKLWQKRKL